MKRRRALLAAASAAVPGTALATALGLAPAIAAAQRPGEPGVSADTLTLGTTAPFSGALQEWGQEYQRGADAYFAHLNAQGGVHGRRVLVQYLDDGYDAMRTVANARLLVQQRGVFALINLCGTANTEALLPQLDTLRVPVIGTASGSDTVRAPAARSRWLFHTRAGYAEETDKIAEFLDTTGVRRIAIVHQANPLGLSGLASARQALARRGIEPVAVASVETNAANVPAAVQAVAATSPAVIVLVTAGIVSCRFISAYQETGVPTQFFGLNIIGSRQLVSELGERVRGVMVSQVTPHPWTGAQAISREYQRLMERAGHSELSFVSMEGFVNAKLAALALQWAGPQPTRERFVSALESAREIDLGGFVLRYTPQDHNGSRRVDLTILDAKAGWLR